MKYSDKKEIIEAIQFKAALPRSWRKCRKLVGEAWITKEECLPSIRTPKGDMDVLDGDYIVKCSDNNIQLYRQEGFAKTYKPVDKE